ncbi:alpha-1,2-fucosyltransferase [Oenococcus oeni]|uniref:alpha-1,2-fucosyltransferase n=1 Tax=Oenococcus oeni TaxID=1247 RepID=UPI0008F85080|nr:alpha-1,2-fucosyltransferase [Oenococcus oeni]OIK55890.1 hypothetical protein ATW61_09990 [Oenococcus oeni]OIM61827.1 hypothetical protein ATX87_09715 [Oenococcus oeni]
MIYATGKGNIGNQMFIYALARKISIDNHQLISFNLKEIKRLGYSFDLDKFCVKELSIDTKPHRFTSLLIFLNRVLTKLTRKDHCLSLITYKILRNFNYFYWDSEMYIDFKAKKENKNIYLNGYWQSAKYFENIRKVLIKEFQPKFPRVAANKDLYRIIENTESICVSIRRGDYANNEKIRDKYLVTDDNYYYESVNRIRDKYHSVSIILFSDDINWVKQNMKFKGNVYYESGSDPVWEKMRLMSLCKHFVLSNSSFSWWAQYLSQNSNKIVYAPKLWYKDGRKSDIYMNNWHTL